MTRITIIGCQCGHRDGGSLMMITVTAGHSSLSRSAAEPRRAGDSDCRSRTAALIGRLARAAGTVTVRGTVTVTVTVTG